MRFRITVVTASLLFCLAPASTLFGSDVNILFQDTSDGVVVTVGGVVSGAAPCNTLPLEICVLTLGPFPQATITSTGPGGSGSYPTMAHFAEPGTGASTLCPPPPSPPGGSPSAGPCISDGLQTTIVSLIGPNTPKEINFTFNSDPATSESLPACSITPDNCLFTENGTQQEVGTITVTTPTTTTTYHVLVQSDVPEPTSLILFGSGLVMAGTFIRRLKIV